MKRITILLGGQGHGLVIKPAMQGLAEIKKYGQVYKPRVCMHSTKEGDHQPEPFELYAWEAVPDDMIVQLAGHAIRRGFTHER